ncbi:endopeptidase La, partial [Acinetobacter baumannii]
MEIIYIAGYSEREKLEIAKRYLVPRQTQENGLRADQFEITEDALKTIIERYTREAGVRQLERAIAQIARKAALKIATGEAERV